jgi:hypothetical protein
VSFGAVFSAALLALLLLLVVGFLAVVLFFAGRLGFFCWASADSTINPSASTSKHNLIMRFFILCFFIFLLVRIII